MPIIIEFQDYQTEHQVNTDSSVGGHAIFTYKPREDSSYLVFGRDKDGDAQFRGWNFDWWIGCQHAIKLTWQEGKSVILKAKDNLKFRKDKESQLKVINYFNKLIDNGFKFMPFEDCSIELPTETEFMDI